MKTVVITSIQAPTPAVHAYRDINGYETVVVGDHKTPSDWSLPGVQFLSLEQQRENRLGQTLPLNCYARKMLGYVWAIRNGAELIIDTDDDNIPNKNWGFPDFSGEYPTTDDELGFVNVYSFYSDTAIWPRGFPLPLIRASSTRIDISALSQRQVNVGVWQALADGDPDVDAIWRLTTGGEDIRFHDAGTMILSEGTISPFNSQNTAFVSDVFPLLYLPVTVHMRFTDILRGYVAQPILWAYGLCLGFTGSTVFQDRNPHNLLADFFGEQDMYRYCGDIIEIISPVIRSSASIEDNLRASYEKLISRGIVTREEEGFLNTWLQDIATLSSGERR